MEERQSRLSSTVWRRFRPYLCVRLIIQNSMFSNFCHVLKRNLLRLYLPNAIISERPTCPHVRLSIIRMMMSLSRCRMFPLSHLRKSGTEAAKFISRSRILPCGTNLFITFAVWLSLCASIERLWSSGSIFNVTVWYSPIKLLKIYHLTKFLTTYFQENKWLSSLHPNCPRYKITHFSTMRRNLKWKNRVFSINDSVKIAEVVET